MPHDDRRDAGPSRSRHPAGHRNSPTMHDIPLTGLVLSGGGARAAYQVGVLRAVMRLRREALTAAGSQTGMRRNPFAVITGTSRPF